MTKKVNCIMLIDDNKDDNFYHERIIKKHHTSAVVISKESAMEALDYLTAGGYDEMAHPNLIFLDINMPGMNGWEFIEEYKKLDKKLQSGMVVVMLTTSDNPDDKTLAKTKGVLADFRTKPLTKEMLDEILIKYKQD